VSIDNDHIYNLPSWSQIKQLEEDQTILSFRELVSDPGRIGLDSLLQEIEKLRIVRDIQLPSDLFSGVPPIKF
jgi:hypothetical protein